MAVAQKLGCVVERIVDHGERVYTLALRPERPVPRFRAGQFLHLALDPYDPTGFWPESRVFSIASSPAAARRRAHHLRRPWRVHRADGERARRRRAAIWIKLPYGDFVIESGPDVVLFAGRDGGVGVHGLSRGSRAGVGAAVRDPRPTAPARRRC